MLSHMSFLSYKELTSLGIKSVGSNVLISRYAKLYNPGNMVFGNNIRVDDYCILSSGKNPFIFEDYIHIAGGVYIYGHAGFHIKKFSNISSGTKIYTQSDSYCGNFMIGPTIPIQFRNVYGSPLVIEKHVIIGTGVTVLPGSIIGEGVAIGANSLVTKECKPWGIYVGSPAKCIKERSKKVLELEKELS
jgi:acetyltransferase-like isoleucine patch superfamily enzyme